MHFRLIAGLILIALALFPPSAAYLPGPEAFSFAPAERTGTVSVIMNDLGGTGTPENVAFAYRVGDVTEVVKSTVSADQESGVVTITMDEGTPRQKVLVLSDKNSGNGIYRIRTIAVAQESEPLLTNTMSFTAAAPVANFYMDNVPAGKQHEWIDLDWKDPARDFNLTVYAPDETFGPYQDMADGKKDGRIFLDVSSILNVTPGTWFFKVQNNQPWYIPYTLNTYSA